MLPVCQKRGEEKFYFLYNHQSLVQDDTIVFVDHIQVCPKYPE